MTNFSPIYSKPSLFAKIERKLRKRDSRQKKNFTSVKSQNDTWTSSEREGIV